MALRPAFLFFLVLSLTIVSGRANAARLPRRRPALGPVVAAPLTQACIGVADSSASRSAGLALFDDDSERRQICRTGMSASRGLRLVASSAVRNSTNESCLSGLPAAIPELHMPILI
jgi:hypothetical protein